MTGYDRQGCSLRLSRFLDRGLVPCGSAGSGLTDADARRIRAALDARQAVIVTVKYRGFTPSGELRQSRDSSLVSQLKLNRVVDLAGRSPS